MDFIDEYRNSDAAAKLSEHIHKLTTRPWKIMEICGGQTHSIVKYGLDSLLPDAISLIHGPGCPVCVTPLEMLDKAHEIASRPDVILCSFGDMLRVPGSSCDLLSCKARGADIRTVYSPLDALRIAESNPKKQVVFFAVGFETTAPTTAMALYQAHRKGVHNFSLLVSHVRVPPAMEAILGSAHNQVQGFLLAGHVCAVMGYSEYEPLAKRYSVPMVVTGFEPIDLLEGVMMTVAQLEQGRVGVENQYSRVVCREGNRLAMNIVNEVYEVVDRKWRGLGEIPNSGLGIRACYSQYDADLVFQTKDHVAEEPQECQSGLVLQGLIKPPDCPAFGTKCTPEHPLGATMVSSEGACAAYYRYKNIKNEVPNA